MRRLLIRPGAIGDCILSFPALRHLRASYTEVWIPSAVLPLVQFADRVHSIASTGLDLVGIANDTIQTALRERLCSFDEIVSWYGSNRPEFRSALEATNVPCIFHRALPDRDCALHAIDYFARQVGAPAGLAPSVSLPSIERRNTVVIHPFSGSLRKNWPLDRYRELASRLPVPVEWSAGPDEQLENARRFDNLFDLANWMAGAALYVGNDSGISHLAAAAGVSTFTIFGPSDARKWAPRGRSVHVLEAGTIERLPVELVLELVGGFAGFGSRHPSDHGLARC